MVGGKLSPIIYFDKKEENPAFAVCRNTKKHVSRYGDKFTLQPFLCTQAMYMYLQSDLRRIRIREGPPGVLPRSFTHIPCLYGVFWHKRRMYAKAKG